MTTHCLPAPMAPESPSVPSPPGHGMARSPMHASLAVHIAAAPNAIAPLPARSMLVAKASTAAVSAAAHSSSTTLAPSACTATSATTVAAGGSSEAATSNALLMPPAPVGSRAFSTPGTGSFALSRTSSAASVSTAGSVSSTSAAALMQSQRAQLMRKNLPLVLSSLPELVSVQSLRQTALSSLQAAADAFDTFLESNAGILLDQSSSAARPAGTHTTVDSTITARPTLVKSASLTHCRAAAAEAASAASFSSVINVPTSVRSPPLGASPSPQSASSSCSLATPVARTPTTLAGGPPPFRMLSRKPSLNNRRAQHAANAAAAAAAGASAKHGLPPLSRVLSPVSPPQYSPAVVSPPVVSPPVHSPPPAGGIPTHSPPLRSANYRHPAVPHVTVTSPTGSLGSPSMGSVSPCVVGGAAAGSVSFLHNLPPLATSPALHSHTNGCGSGSNSACSSTSHSRGLSMPVFDRATVAALGAMSGHSNPTSPRPPTYSPAAYGRTPYVIGEAQLQAMLAQNEQNRAIMLHAEAYRLQAPHAAESSLKLGLNISVGGNSPHSNGQTPCGRTSALASPTLSETGSTTSRTSVSSTRSLVRSPGSSPPPVEKPAWALRLASKPLLTFSDDDGALSVPRPGSSMDSTSSRSSQNGHNSRFGGGGGMGGMGGLNMSLSIPCDMILDRAQSYVVREHTVVVGAYRINQNGLFAANGLPSATSHAAGGAMESPEDHDEEDEHEEQQEEGAEDSNDSGYDDDETTCAEELAHSDHSQHGHAADDAQAHLSPASAAAAAATLAVANDNEGGQHADAHSAETQAANSSKRSFADRAAKIARSRARHGTMPASLSSQHQARPGFGLAGGGRASVSQLVSSTGSSRSAPQPQAMCLSKEDLVELEVVGRGQNGNVRKAVHLPTLTRVALKSMDIYEKGTRHQLLHELHAFSGLNSPYLISFLGAYHDSGRIFLATEYMDCGSLSHFAHRLGGRGGGPGRISDERILKHISAQILRGLQYLHENHRVHRDIKPDNILLNRLGQVKLADYGLMVRLDPARPSTSDFLGTLAYLSPERLASDEYSYGADIWSLAVSLIYVATGQLPVVGQDYWDFMSAMDRAKPSLQNTLDDIAAGRGTKRGPGDGSRKSDNVAASMGGEEDADDAEGDEIPRSGSDREGEDGENGDDARVSPEPLHFSQSFHDFLSHMLEMDPSKRWSAAQLLSHEFLSDVEDTTLTHPAAWGHAQVLASSARDLDVILELLATRQIAKKAREEVRRIARRNGSDDVADEVPDRFHARTPGHALGPAFSYENMEESSQHTHGMAAAEAATAAAAAAAKAEPELPVASPCPLPSPASAPAGAGPGGFPRGLHLATSTSPLVVPPNTPSTRGGAMSEGPMSLSSQYSAHSASSARSLDAFSPETEMLGHGYLLSLPASSNLLSSTSASSMASEMFSPGCGTATSMAVDAAYTPMQFGSPSPQHLHPMHVHSHSAHSFVSPSPDPVPMSYGMHADSNFVLPVAPMMGCGSEAEQRSSLCLQLGSPLMVLPTAPATFGCIPEPRHEVSPPAAAASASGAGAGFSVGVTFMDAQSPPKPSSRRMSVVATGPAASSERVDIYAVVCELDASRLAVLSQQYSLSCDDIQARFAQVQLELFDRLDVQQKDGEEAEELQRQQQQYEQQQQEQF